MMKKLVIVTGSSNGIGRAIAEEFLKNDFSVVGIDRLDSTIENVNYHHYKKDIFYDELPDIPNCEILINNAGSQNVFLYPALRVILEQNFQNMQLLKGE